MQLRRGNQYKKKSNVTEYEIKTYGSTAGRNRSPGLSNKRSPVRNDNAVGEMAYFDPNELNPRPINSTIRSPIRMSGTENYERTEMNNNQNTYNRYPQTISMQDGRREKLSRSPKTINIGESAQDAEYNMKSFNRRSPGYSNSGQDNPVIERTYNMISNEAGNIFLDQPIQQTSFVNQQEVIDSPIDIGRGSFEDSRDFGGREMQYSINPRDFHEPLPGILGKMSPKANVDGDSESGSNSEKNDNTHQIKDLRTQLEKKRSVRLRDDDGMVEGTKPIQNELEKIEDMVKAKEKETRDNITEEEVKKLVKLYVKEYDPKKTGEGRLISKKQTVVPSMKDDLFNDRYKVLQKMNKLSNILLSKNRNAPSFEINSLNRKSYEQNRSFDKNTLNSTVPGRKVTYRGKHNKFLFVSLAMLSAKGPGADDKTILRRMRLDKGGVVDLAQENDRKKTKFKIKKVKASVRGQNMINPKYKEKAAKIVQAWWRDQKAKYKNILNQIIKIQSVWRGKFTRKYVYDIIYLSYLHQRFFDIMEKTLVSHTRPLVWDELFSRTKLAKKTMKGLLERKDMRYTTIRLKPYFHRWKVKANFLKNRILKSKNLVINKENKQQSNAILKKYMDRWRLKANLFKYMGKAKNAEDKKQKFMGALEIFNGIKSRARKTSFKNSNVPIKKYLETILREKLMKKIINNNSNKEDDMRLRHALNKFRENVYHGRLNDLKADTFNKHIEHALQRLQKNILKKKLYQWRKKCPTGRRILSINDGAEILKKFTLRTTIGDPLSAMAEKIDDADERNKMLKLFNIKRRKIKDSLRHCLNKWRHNTIRMDDKNYRNDIYKSLLKNLINNIERRILYKRFNQWRQRPKIDIKNEMSKFRKFSDILSDVMKNNLRLEKYDFFDKLETTRAKRVVAKTAKNMFKNYKKKDRRLLRHYFYKWRSQIKNSEIDELQSQIMRYLFISQENRANRLNLAKYMTRWRLFVSDKKNYDNMEKLKKVYKAGDILGNLKNRRGRDFIIRLYRKMGNDYRPIILDKLTRKLNEPRSTLRECFDRWRRINTVQKAGETLSSMKAKFFKQGAKKITDRSNRDDLMKAFFRWKNIIRKPDEYYPKITRGFDFLTKYVKKELCNEPFNKISVARNFIRPMKKLLKNYNNQQNRLLNGKLRNLLGRWRKMAGESNISDLKADIILKTKNNIDNLLKAKTLAKYFTRWKLYRRKGLDVNFSKGIEILTNLYREPFLNDVIDAYGQKVDHVCKLKATNNLVKATNRYSKSLLHDAFIKMWKGAISIDPNRMRKIKTRLRRIIKHNEEEPRAKAFHRWANQIKLLQFRDKDMERARKMIGNTLRNNDKMNLNYAMSRWKKKIQMIREQYLKSLLVKQIKSAQMVKEKMNNQAKLRAALLKWRATLAPVNYLDRLKHIRKGCKIFKRGLKKRDERQIFDGIRELAKQNRKTFLLDEIVNTIRPHLDKYQMQKAINIWKSKLGDTQRMKNKMSTLLDDYLYSDKIHDNLIRSPAFQILDALKTYDQTKRDKAKQIDKFLKGVLEAKNNLNKMKALLKLKDLIRKKNKDLDYIKRMQFRRYHRNVQKINNEENARIIQRFIKAKLRTYFDKRELVKKGVGVFELYLKKRCLNNIADRAKDNLMKRVLRNALNRQDAVNNKTLSDSLNKWRNLIPVLQKHEAANTIQNAFRALQSRKKLDNLKKRLEKLLDLHEKYEIKNSQLLHSTFREWLNRANMLKNTENAAIIQNFIRTKMMLRQIRFAKLKLRSLFKKDAIHQLSHIMERSSRIIGGKGEVVYKAVQDILYKNPFDALIERIKFLGKVNALKKVQPKIHEALKNYYLPLALKKWKNNTYDQTVKHTQEIQKFLRMKYKQKMAKDKQKREALLKRFLEKLHKNNLYKLQLPFNVWHKKAKLLEASENANRIQTAFRCYIGQKHAGEMLAKNKLKQLFKVNQLKNLLDAIKEAGNNKILNEDRKSVLTSIMKRKSYTDDKSALKRYFDKWRQYNLYLHNCASKIANAYRTMRANKEKNRLQRIKDILYKSILKHEKVDNSQMRSKLRKWNNKAKLISVNENGRIIQRFIRPKLYKLLNEKVKKFFLENAKKKTNKLLLLAAKFRKLQKSLDRPSLQRFSNNLKLLALKNAQRDKLRNLALKKDDKINDLLLKKYFDRWRQQNDKINTKRELSAIMIQTAFRGLVARKDAHRQLTINKALTNAILRKSKIYNNQLYSTFKRWLNTVRNLTLNRNAKIIQDFCRDILDRLNEQKELSKKLRYNNGFDKLCKIKFGAKYAFSKLRNKSDETLFIRCNNNLKNKRLKILKDCFNNLKSNAFDKKLRGALKVPDSLKERILKKIINKWNDNAQKLANKHGAELIQKNWRIYLFKKKQENKKYILKDLLLKLAKKNSNTKGKYFSKWNAIAMKLKENAIKSRFARYIRDKYKTGEARKNWIKLVKKYYNNKRNDDLFTVVDTMKQYVILDRMKDPFIHKARVSVIQMFKDKIKKSRIVTKLKKMLPERNDKNGHDTIVKYFGRWKLSAEKMRQRDKKLDEALNKIETRDMIKDINKLNAAFLMKKLFSDIPKIHAKLFLQKLKNKAKDSKKYDKLKNGIKKARDDLLIQNKDILMTKIYKIYAFSKIKNMFKALDGHLQKKTKPKFSKDFLKKLYEIRRKKAQYNYEDKINSTHKAPMTKLNFKKKLVPNTPENVIEDKYAPIKKCMPSFVNFLHNKLKERRQDTMNVLKQNDKEILFSLLIRKYAKREILQPKKEVVGVMKREGLYKESRPLNQIKLFKLFRRKYIQELTASLEEPSKLYQLYYLINVTAMHQRIAKQRFIRELIRKWRFAAFAKKIARNKLELMYKNLHASYLQMADEFFGDDNVNPSVIKEFERFGNNVGMFTGEEPQVGEDMNKKYYSTVEKKYVFDKGYGDDMRKSVKKTKIIKEETEEVEEIEEKRTSIKPKNRNSKILNRGSKKDPFAKYKKK